MNLRLRNLGASVVLLGVYGIATLPILKSFPPVWPDEVNLYGPAAALARGQGMGTAVLAGFLPGIEHHTYWQPPGYFFFLSLLLRLVPVAHHFVAMRVFSWLLGAAVLLLGAAILKRLTRRWTWALLGLVLLATEVGFMQAANVGRMEMLSLACTVAALDAYLAFRQKRLRSVLAFAGFLAGLALLCHPAGIAAASVMVVHELVSPPDRSPASEPGESPGPRWKSRFHFRERLEDATVFAGAAALPFIPWLVYILHAPSFFFAQMAAQSNRKSLLLGTLLERHGIAHWLMSPFQNAACPLGAPWLGLWPLPVGSAELIPLAILGVGLAGLLAVGRRRVEASLLGAWVLAGYAINLFMPEFWYTVCFLTPCCILLGWTFAEASRRGLRAAALVVLLMAGAWNFAEAKLMWWYCRDGWQAYQLYCLTLTRLIPPRSTVLLAVIPDPYFGLLERDKSYRMLEFVPLGVPVEQAQAEAVLDHVDYVVGSDCCRPRYLSDYLRLHGKVVASLGEWDFLSPPVVLWKLRDPAKISQASSGP